MSLTELEIYRFLLTSIPDAFLNFLAALVLLGENIKRIKYRIIIFGLLSALLSFATFEIIKESTIIRQVLNITVNILLIKSVFQLRWFTAGKYFAVFWCFTALSNILAFLYIVYALEIPMTAAADDVLLWVTVFWPALLSSLAIACLGRRLNKAVFYFFTMIKEDLHKTGYYQVYLSLGLQAIILLALWNEISLNHTIYAENLLRGLTITLAFFLLFATTIFTLVKVVKVTREKAVKGTQDTISENIASLINAIRSQRHDFINHVQVINSLFHLGNKEDLRRYLADLGGDISAMNSILKVDNPFISALLNAKTVQAELKGIKLEVIIEANLSSLSSKALDLTRILGNLIDNAIEAVEQAAGEDKWVKVLIEEKGPLLAISVNNPGVPSTVVIDKIFTPGFTTKCGEHSGLGLYICKQLARKLHGTIEYSLDHGSGTTFSFLMPRS